jgi:hypothetical protein
MFRHTHNFSHQGRDIEDVLDDIVHIHGLNRIVAEGQPSRHIAQNLGCRTGIAIDPDKACYCLIAAPEIQLHTATRRAKRYAPPCLLQTSMF